MSGNKMYLKKMFLFLVCITSLAAQAPLYGGKSSQKNGTFHLIIVADTKDRRIGESDKKDVLNLVPEVKKIASYAKVNYSPYLLYHDKSAYDHLLRIISQLKVEDNDTVFFYYTGHGYRTTSKGDNPWPNLYLRDRGADFSYIVELLLKKTPRLLIAISDSCNNVIDHEGFTVFIPRKERDYQEGVRAKIGQNRKSDNYKQLFYYSKGLVMASASVPGDVAITESITGAFYTGAFLQSLEEETNFESTSWNILMQKTEDKVNLLYQYPQWIYLEDVSNIDATLRLIGR